MRESFAWLQKQFDHIKNDNDLEQCDALLKQLQIFIDKYSDVTEVDEQVLVAQALEYQLLIYMLMDQKEKAEEVEHTLNEEFCGIHKIGKIFDKNIAINLLGTSGKLNLPQSLLDTDRLKKLAVKQKGNTKPKLIGWALKIIGLALIGLAAWLFSIQWIWMPLILGIIGVLISAIGTQVTNVINHFFGTVAFNAGVIIPGMVIKTHKDKYEIAFVVPLMKSMEQAARWGVKTIMVKREIGNFYERDHLAGVCVFGQVDQAYYQDFIPVPVAIGYRNDIIAYKAKQIIPEADWQRLDKLVDLYGADKSLVIVVDAEFKKTSLSAI